MAKLFRQGDVALVEVKEIPSKAKKVENKKEVVLALGEVTGHKHRLDSQHVTELQEGTASRFLQVDKTSTLNHEEHATLTIPEGNYQVIQQNEYTPASIRAVMD